MNPSIKASARIYLLCVALTGWFGLILQWYILLQQARELGTPIFSAIANYFSYFTILTNIIVAGGSTCCLFFYDSGAGKFFLRPGVQAGTAMQISIVGIVYSLVLRELWEPKGLQLVADIILHDAIPLLYVIYWIFLAPKGLLKWSDPVLWLAYPMIYSVYSLIRGFYTDRYPYPFIDVTKLGYRSVFINMLILLTGFLILGMLIVFLDKYIFKISPEKKSKDL